MDCPSIGNDIICPSGCNISSSNINTILIEDVDLKNENFGCHPGKHNTEQKIYKTLLEWLSGNPVQNRNSWYTENPLALSFSYQ